MELRAADDDVDDDDADAVPADDWIGGMEMFVQKSRRRRMGVKRDASTRIGCRRK